ncbi:hypothetical protein GCM10023310_05310 [Paenibacillus vulneris]
MDKAERKFRIEQLKIQLGFYICFPLVMKFQGRAREDTFEVVWRSNNLIKNF